MNDGWVRERELEGERKESAREKRRAREREKAFKKPYQSEDAHGNCVPLDLLRGAW